MKKSNLYNSIFNNNLSNLASFVLDILPYLNNYKKNKKLYFLYADYFMHKKQEIGYYMMAECYRYGYYVSRDYKKALYFYKKAATNVAFAIPEIGYMYMMGLGVKKDLSKALNYFRYSIKPPFPEPRGYLYLGDYYYCFIKNNTINKKKALLYYKRSLKDGDYITQKQAYDKIYELDD